MDDLKILSGRDKDRMQRDLFYPDLCTSKKYLAFVDTDTMLTLVNVYVRVWMGYND